MVTTVRLWKERDRVEDVVVSCDDAVAAQGGAFAEKSDARSSADDAAELAAVTEAPYLGHGEDVWVAEELRAAGGGRTVCAARARWRDADGMASLT